MRADEYLEIPYQGTINMNREGNLIPSDIKKKSSEMNQREFLNQNQTKSMDEIPIEMNLD